MINNTLFISQLFDTHNIKCSLNKVNNIITTNILFIG